MKTPKDYRIFPLDSVSQKSEAEEIARNIMIILWRTGNIFRKLSFEEYKEERQKDGGWGSSEEYYFNQVIKYTVSPEAAACFSPAWEKITNS